MILDSLSPSSTESVLRDYFHAKDENRPHYMARAFADDAVLKMALRTQAIAFPPESHGLAAIADTLVRKPRATCAWAVAGTTGNSRPNPTAPPT
ncbi:hypothetical protein G6F65_020046 [Rhizopus arrhizus]|nr:hypothetical protein G6F65_020046 [Rhizopus arrhizus]